jgi:hypothetical protein
MVALPTTVDARLAAHAAALDEEAGRVRKYRLNVNRMRELGTLVDLDIHGFTMFTVRASWLDLGIRAGDVRTRQFTRGAKHLVPRGYIKKLNSLDSRFRHSLEKHSLAISGFLPYRWVSYKAYPKWKEELAALRADLEALKEDLIANYDTIKDDLAKDYGEIAHEAWDALIGRQGGNPDHAALDLGDGRTFANRAAFVEYVTQRVLDRLPKPDDIRSGIYVTYRNALMLSEADIEEDHLAAELFRAARAEAEARTAHADEEAEAQRRLVWAEEAAQKEVIDERARTARRLVRAEAEAKELEVKERRIKLQAMLEEERAHARQLIADTLSPFEEGILKERAQLHAGLNEVLDTIKKNGYLHGNTANKMRNLVERYRDFGALFDGDLDLEVDSLEAALERRIPHPDRKGATTYDIARLTAQAKQLVDLTADAARKLSRDVQGTRAGALMF